MFFLPTEVGKRLLNLHPEVGQFFCFKTHQIFVIARPLTVEETESIDSLAYLVSEHIVHDWVCEKAVVYASCGLEQLLSTEKAGYTKSFAEAILRRSTIKDDKDFLSRLEDSRQKFAQTDKYIDTVLSNVLGIKNTKGVSSNLYVDNIARVEMIKGQKLIEDTKENKFNRKSRAPKIPPGFSSVQAESILSKESATKITPDIIEKENEEFLNNT